MSILCIPHLHKMYDSNIYTFTLPNSVNHISRLNEILKTGSNCWIMAVSLVCSMFIDGYLPTFYVTYNILNI